MYYVVYSEYEGRWSVWDYLPADTAGRGYSEWEDFGRTELDAQHRNAEQSLYE